jgi:Protein of unknown function (DUF3106)
MGEVRGEKATVAQRRSRTTLAGVVTLLIALLTTAPAIAQRGSEHHQVQRAPAKPSHAGQWLRNNRNLSPAEQQRSLENDPQFKRLPPQQQEQLRQRLQHFNQRSPEDQQKIINRMDTWGHLSPEQKQQARQLHQQWQQLPPDRRQAVQNAVKTLRTMPPEARQAAIDSPAYKSQFSPQERQMLSGASKLPLAPAIDEDDPGPDR